MSVRALIGLFFVCVPLSTFGADSKNICGTLPPEAQEMEVAWIAESELTAAEVMKAVADLEKARDPSWGGGHHDHLTFGHLRIIEGYTLKYMAEHYKTRESVKKFCNWLSTKAYWPE